MSDFKTRLLEEKQQLDEKIEKLNSFLGSEAVGAVDGVQLTLLNVQVKAMETMARLSAVCPPIVGNTDTVKCFLKE